MNTKISRIPSPALAGVVRESSVQSAIAEIANCTYSGADMIDLHVSCLDENDEESLRKVISSSRLPVLALNYNNSITKPDGFAGFTEEERIESFLRAVRAGAHGIDMQGYTFHEPSKTGFYGENKYSFTKDSPKEVVTDEKIIAKQCEMIERVHSMGAEVLLSCHPSVYLSCEQVVDLALFLERRGPDMIKIVSVATNEDELAESIRAMTVLKKEIRIPVAYHASGAAGIASRIINPILGGHIAFCVDRYKVGSTVEQPELRTVRGIVDNVRKITKGV